jgi:hypothetical protein
MSGENEDRVIRIKLEVTIPAGVAAPIIQTSACGSTPGGVGAGVGQTGVGGAAGGTGKQLRLMAVSRPKAECVLPGSPPRARICMTGSAPPKEPFGFPRFAHGVINADSGEAPGASPPPYLRVVDVNPSNGSFAFQGATGLDGVPCDTLIERTITVWYEYRNSDGSVIDFAKETSLPFTVSCTGLPACGETSPPPALATLAASIPTLAYRYVVETSGFAGPEVGFFNGLWHLKMSSHAPDQISFESSPGAGGHVTLVLSMTGHRLVFQFGKSSVTYSMGCCGFHGSGESVFGRVECVGIGQQNSVPASVVLRAVS